MNTQPPNNKIKRETCYEPQPQEGLPDESHKIRRELLTDKSPMPFGKYKGYHMETVPASYLLWFLHESGPALSEGEHQVKQYVWGNEAALQYECPDYITSAPKPQKKVRIVPILRALDIQGVSHNNPDGSFTITYPSGRTEQRWD
jgi:hypothetical protein